MPGKLVRCLRSAVPGDVGWRRDRDDRNFVGDAYGDHVAFQPLGVANAGIEAAGYDVGKGAVGGDLHADLRVGDEKAADVGYQTEIGDRRRNGQAHDAGGLVAKIVHQVERSTVVVEYGPQPRQQTLAGDGRRHRPRCALDQPYAQPLLKLTEHLANARWRQVQVPGRFAEALLFEHGHEGTGLGKTRLNHPPLPMFGNPEQTARTIPSYGLDGDSCPGTRRG